MGLYHQWTLPGCLAEMIDVKEFKNERSGGHSEIVAWRRLWRWCLPGSEWCNASWYSRWSCLSWWWPWLKPRTGEGHDRTRSSVLHSSQRRSRGWRPSSHLCVHLQEWFAAVEMLINNIHSGCSDGTLEEISSYFLDGFCSISFIYVNSLNIQSFLIKIIRL